MKNGGIEGKQENPIDLSTPTPPPSAKSPTQIDLVTQSAPPPRNAPSRNNKEEANKGKGKATTTVGHTRKGLLQEGERYASRHLRVEWVWEKRTNVRRPGERRGIREDESSQYTTDSGADRCKNCGNRHSRACWPECEECGKRHRLNECRGRPKLGQFPPPPRNAPTSCRVCGKSHHGTCKFKDTERCAMC